MALRQQLQQQTFQNVGGIANQLGGVFGQWFGGMGQPEVSESQKLAKAAQAEKTETKVLAWFKTVVNLSPTQRLASWELDPMKNWPAANKYARHLAQNMPTEEAAELTATQQLRGMPGGPAALKDLEQFAGGAGPGNFPLGQVSMERRGALQDPRLAQLAAQFGPVGREAGMERFGRLPGPTTSGWKPKSWEGLLEEEAIEGKQAARVEEFWQEKDPQRLLYKARQEAQVEAKALLGEHGYPWFVKRLEKLGVPEWVEKLSDSEKARLGLVKVKDHYEMQKIDGVSPDTQAMYLQLMNMDPVYVNDLTDKIDRAEVRMIAYGGMMERMDLVTKEISPKMRNLIESYRQQPLALKSKDEQMNHIIALMGVIGLRQIKALLWLLERPETRETVSATGLPLSEAAWAEKIGFPPK